MNLPSQFHTIALTLCAALGAAVVLTAADKPAEKASEKPAADDGDKPEPATPKPLPPPYRVIPAYGAPSGPALPGDADQRRKSLEEALNKAYADGYQFAGMNGDWVVLEHRFQYAKSADASGAPPRRRVVLPTGP